MIKNTKNTVVVFAFVAMLMAMPLATSAFAASGGSGVINPSCGITEPATMNIGAVTRGADQASATRIDVVTTGSVTGTFEVILTDWAGTGAKAENSILVGTPVAGVDILDIDGNKYQAVVTNSATGDFEVNANPSTTASNLAAVINADIRGGTQAGFDQTATAFDNAIFVRNNEVGGTVGNIVVFAQDAGTGLPVQVSGGTLKGGEEVGVKHMDAEDTHYAITTDESTVSNGYGAKTPHAANTVNKVLSTTTDPSDTKDIFWYIHLSGVDTQATGTVTVESDLAEDDTFVLNGVTFVSESSLPLDALEFDNTGANAAADAANLRTAILLNADTRYTVGSVVGDGITFTAVKPGEHENEITMVQTGDGMAVSAATFTGGDTNLEALPFTGGITTTATFGTRC